MSTPVDPPSRVLRYAVTAGILTDERLRERERYAARHGIDILLTLTDAERLHLLLILKALGAQADLSDALDAIHRLGSRKASGTRRTVASGGSAGSADAGGERGRPRMPP